MFVTFCELTGIKDKLWGLWKSFPKKSSYWNLPSYYLYVFKIYSTTI